MALIVCPECGREISDQAEACIHCGYPLAKRSKKEKPDAYSLVLEKVFHEDRILDVLCREYGMEDIQSLPEELPCVLKTSVSYKEAAAMWRELAEFGWLKILRDEDAADPVKIREAPSISWLEEQEEDGEKREGMSFGMTVGAVVLGVIAAILLLSLF